MREAQRKIHMYTPTLICRRIKGSVIWGSGDLGNLDSIIWMKTVRLVHERALESLQNRVALIGGVSVIFFEFRCSSFVELERSIQFRPRVMKS